ncbi:putative exonuclease [Wickerhamomyces ciferrii]|uniref:Exonuclease n=1 Tax=Wickerhamomyces ciferrii (strain ATCC 14091 / BCRC 22168 / CBS 111 / JCM 3599 / NBRC 0793 / NRRL Y-1031 F-60-10) TaxID=1206466 RepID=K0KQJ0_WICCF|nr:putative exonuclease [Wickerhamomyces ciferrii]CCH45306.1 putative exonuclease [Wickerhamomyces ciferrii]
MPRPTIEDLRSLILTFEDMKKDRRYPIHSASPGCPDGGETIRENWVSSQFSNTEGPTKAYALGCEFVVMDDDTRQVGHIMLLDFDGKVVFDELIRPRGQIKTVLAKHNSQTPIRFIEHSWFSLKDIQDRLFKIVSAEDIIIGHTVYKDLQALEWKHPKIVDTVKIFSYIHPQESPSLDFLTLYFLGSEYVDKISRFSGPVVDARAVLDLTKFEIKCWNL